MEVRAGVVRAVRPLEAFDAARDGRRIEARYADASIDRLVANPAVARLVIGRTRVDVPATRRSVAGQLLDICRINHAHRIGDSTVSHRPHRLFQAV